MQLLLLLRPFTLILSPTVVSPAAGGTASVETIVPSLSVTVGAAYTDADAPDPDRC